jgi:hypothetical protein
MRKIALNPKKAVIKGLFVMRTKRYALFIFRAYLQLPFYKKNNIIN